MKRIGALTGALLLSFAGLAAVESEGYVKLTANNGVDGFSKALWSESVADPSTRDYLVTDGKIYKPGYIKNSREPIHSRSFTFGEVGGGKGNFHAYYDSEFLNEGVIFANGDCYPNQTYPKIYGKATIASPATAPFRFRGSGGAARGITFAGKVVCPETCGILAYSYRTNGFYLAFSEDVSQYCGSVVITSEYDKAGLPWGADLIFKENATFFGGSVTVGADATLKTQVATSIDTVTLKNGAALDIGVGCKLEVRTSFNKEDGPIAVRISNASVKDTEARYDLLSMPAESNCSLEDFEICNDESTFTMIKSIGFDLSDDGKTKTLYAVYYAAVTFTDNEESKASLEDPYSFCSVTNAESWSDSQVVHGDAIYRIVKNGGRTTYFTLPYNEEDEPYVFPAPALYFSADTAFVLRSKENTVSNVFFTSAGNKDIFGLRNNKNDLSLFSDRIVVDGKLNLNVRTEIKLRLIGAIEGNDDTEIKLQCLSGSTTQCRGYGELRGDNSKYKGKITITSNRKEEVDSVINFSRFASLIVTAASNLGGPRDSFAYDALSINRYGQLDVRESMVLDEPTRGIYAHGDGAARILVAEAKTLTVKQQLTVDGQLYKEGAGTLALGGNLRFLDAEGNVTETIPENASSRSFYVVGGKVKPIAAHALDGLDVVFSNKTSKLDTGLALDVNAKDAELRAKGVCNVKSPAPFAFQDDDPSKKIPVYLECADEVPSAEYAFGVMTVRKGCEGVFDLLRIVKPASLDGLKLTLKTVEDAEAGTVTLEASMKKYGFAVSIR